MIVVIASFHEYKEDITVNSQMLQKCIKLNGRENPSFFIFFLKFSSPLLVFFIVMVRLQKGM